MGAVFLFFAALLAFAEWSNFRARNREVVASVDYERRRSQVSQRMLGDHLLVSVEVPERFGAKDLAVTDIILSRRLREALSLSPPAGWTELSDLPYTTQSQPPHPVPHGYVHWRGRIPLEDGGSVTISLLVAEPDKASGDIELRYVGEGDMCPVAGSLNLRVGTGQAVPQEAEPYPRDPLVTLSALC